MGRVNDALLWVCKGGLIAMVPVMTIIIFVQVILRYVFLAPLRWPEELARYLLVWISLLGSVYALREGLHVSIAFLKDRLTGYAAVVVSVFVHLSLLVFLIFCTVEGLIFSISQWNHLTPAMEIPMTFPNMAIPVGCGIMFLIGLENLIRDLKGFRSPESGS
ncbi:MAG: TRAP transporter small permease [Deltaproteobacteria bacterium]|nr:TRAP transporter small permease [Deltaproteobacteria bacterium]MBW2120320.1 TRAP transporter small permease [Deltaproteobacteria bacterium]